MTRLPLALAFLAALASCAKQTEPAATVAAKPEPIQACKLLPFEEADPGNLDGLIPAKSEIDVTVGEDFAKCMYSTFELPPRSVAIELRRFASDSKARGAQESTVGYLPRLARADAETVAGVGDEATWAGGVLNQLHVRSGAMRVIVTVEVGEPETRRDRAAAVARKALERLAAPPSAPADQGAEPTPEAPAAGS